MIPIEIINKILEYKKDLEDDMIYLQYSFQGKEYYKINKKCTKLQKIKKIMYKKIYCDFHFSIGSTGNNGNHFYVYNSNAHNTILLQ